MLRITATIQQPSLTQLYQKMQLHQKMQPEPEGTFVILDGPCETVVSGGGSSPVVIRIQLPANKFRHPFRVVGVYEFQRMNHYEIKFSLSMNRQNVPHNCAFSPTLLKDHFVAVEVPPIQTGNSYRMFYEYINDDCDSTDVIALGNLKIADDRRQQMPAITPNSLRKNNMMSLKSGWFTVKGVNGTVLSVVASNIVNIPFRVLGITDYNNDRYISSFRVYTEHGGLPHHLDVIDPMKLTNGTFWLTRKSGDQLFDEHTQYRVYYRLACAPVDDVIATNSEKEWLEKALIEDEVDLSATGVTISVTEAIATAVATAKVAAAAAAAAKVTASTVATTAEDEAGATTATEIRKKFSPKKLSIPLPFFTDGKMDLYISDSLGTGVDFHTCLAPIMICNIRMMFCPVDHNGVERQLVDNKVFFPKSIIVNGSCIASSEVVVSNESNFQMASLIGGLPGSMRYSHGLDYIPITRIERIRFEFADELMKIISRNGGGAHAGFVRVMYDWLPQIPQSLLADVQKLSAPYEIRAKVRELGPSHILIQPVGREGVPIRDHGCYPYDYLVYTGRVVYKGELWDFSPSTTDAEMYARSPDSWKRESRIDKLIGVRARVTNPTVEPHLQQSSGLGNNGEMATLLVVRIQRPPAPSKTTTTIPAGCPDHRPANGVLVNGVFAQLRDDIRLIMQHKHVSCAAAIDILHRNGGTQLRDDIGLIMQHKHVSFETAIDILDRNGGNLKESLLDLQ